MPQRLLQLTDLHLFADAGEQLLGITTRDSFEAVLELALSSQKPTDAMIFTGDLVHDETPAGYRYLRETFKRIEVPHYCVAGNHDDFQVMEAQLGGAALGPIALRRLASWNLVFLDSSVPGEDGGHLSEGQLAHLEDLLADDKAPTIIVLHHHPITIQSAWMDAMSVDNGAKLLALCDRYEQIKGILFGHVHQEFSLRYAQCTILGTPSTCFQFMPGSKDFTIDERPPGYRELTLYPDGRLKTRVVRLDHYRQLPLQQAEGY